MSSTQQGRVSHVTIDVDHNPYLAAGAGTVDAIVSIAIENSGVTDTPPERVEAIIIDCSTSMKTPAGKFDEAKRATATAVDEMADGTLFTIVAGTEKADAVYPADGRPTPASDTTRAAAAQAVEALSPNGGTAMGSWLAHVRAIAGEHPDALTHAILLTDGKNEHETPEELATQISCS